MQVGLEAALVVLGVVVVLVVLVGGGVLVVLVETTAGSGISALCTGADAGRSERSDKSYMSYMLAWVSKTLPKDMRGSS